MKIIQTFSLEIPDIKVIRFARFPSHRGYFVEQYRKSDLRNLDFMKNFNIVQANESFCFKNVMKGFHFQWNPFMGKLVRTVYGHQVDLVIDIRKGSPTWGKVIGYDMPNKPEDNYSDWIWVPAGFAHGNFFVKDSIMEYFCTGEYNPDCEAGISPLAKDLDWSICDKKIKREFNKLMKNNPLMTDKDKDNPNLEDWNKNPNSDNFIYKVNI